jgi:hypothetical protein
MFIKFFDQGDPGGGAGNVTPDPAAEPQGGGAGEPAKGDSSGKPVIDAAEVEKLKVEREKIQKRYEDLQSVYGKQGTELADLRKKVESLTLPKPPTEELLEFDQSIAEIKREIEATEKDGLSAGFLKAQLATTIRLKGLAERQAAFEQQQKEMAQMAPVVGEFPDFKDWPKVGETQQGLNARGEKVSAETAFYYNLGKNLKTLLKDETEKAVTAALEAERKGAGARGQEGGTYIEPSPEEQEELKKMREYAHSLNNPPGLEIK